MTQPLDKYHLILQSINTEMEIKQFLLQLCKELQVDHFFIGLFFPLSIIKSRVLTIDNYREGWRDVYDKRNVINEDPILEYCKSQHSPILWSKIDNPTFNLVKGVLFEGPQSGFTIPLHGPMGSTGMLSLSMSKEDADSEKYLTSCIALTQQILPSLQDAIIRIREQIDIGKAILTDREVECLTWATEGKTAWEISQILNCKERTITFHLNNATKKLNCSNRYQAIAKALLTGVIRPRF